MLKTGLIVFYVGGIVLLLGLGAVSQVALAQRVLLFEDFESATPDPPDPDGCATGMDSEGDAVNLADACIGAESVDTFNRSRVLEETESLATITGASYPDPFDPGNNQSLVISNPFSSTQEAVNWFSIFPDDAADPNYYLRNGIIEFDVYLGPVLPEAAWTFLGIRFGFETDPALRNQVSTVGDQTIWNSFRMTFAEDINADFDNDNDVDGDDFLAWQRGAGITSEATLADGDANGDEAVDDDDLAVWVDQFGITTVPGTATGNLFNQPANTNYVDIDDLIVTEVPLHVRYDIDGDNNTYTVTIDNLEDQRGEVTLVFDDGTADQTWAQFFNFVTFQNEPAPGINEITFITDASSRSTGATEHADVFIDNLRVVDNDQLPLIASVPEPASVALLVLGCALIVYQTRPEKRAEKG